MLKRVKDLVQEYCHRFPAIDVTGLGPAYLTKFTRTCPHTSTKSVTQTFTAPCPGTFAPRPELTHDHATKTLWISTTCSSLKYEHEEILENDLFGKPVVSFDGKYALYCARVSPKPSNYFEKE
jgi:hypothetical protein